MPACIFHGSGINHSGFCIVCRLDFDPELVICLLLVPALCVCLRAHFLCVTNVKHMLTVGVTFLYAHTVYCVLLEHLCCITSPIGLYRFVSWPSELIDEVEQFGSSCSCNDVAQHR